MALVRKVHLLDGSWLLLLKQISGCHVIAWERSPSDQLTHQLASSNLSFRALIYCCPASRNESPAQHQSCLYLFGVQCSQVSL